MKKSATKKEIQVLYQVDAAITDPHQIADILPKLELKDVKAALKGLRAKGLVRAGKVTEEGKAALKRHQRWVFG